MTNRLLLLHRPFCANVAKALYAWVSLCSIHPTLLSRIAPQSVVPATFFLGRRLFFFSLNKDTRVSAINLKITVDAYIHVGRCSILSVYEWAPTKYRRMAPIL